MTAEIGRRAQKKQETTNALIEAADKLFQERGFDATTVEDIAAAANISRRTFFRYFPTKEMVVFPYHEDRLADFLEALHAHSDNPSPFERLRAAFKVLSTTFIEGTDELLKQQKMVEGSLALRAYESTLDNQWEHAVARMLDPNCGEEGRPSYDAQVFAGALIGGVRVALREWRDSNGEKDLAELGLKAIDLIESDRLFPMKS